MNIPVKVIINSLEKILIKKKKSCNKKENSKKLGDHNVSQLPIKPSWG